MKTKLLYLGLTITLSGVVAMLAFTTVLRRSDVSAQTSLPALQTIPGTAVTWKIPGSGWATYDHTNISRLGVDVDECIQNEGLKATLCVKVLDAKGDTTGTPAIIRLFEKFNVSLEHRPRVTINGTKAWFTFSIGSGIVSDAMDIKVSADIAGAKRDKVVMVMGAWSSGASRFSVEGFDVAASQTHLR